MLQSSLNSHIKKLSLTGTLSLTSLFFSISTANAANSYLIKFNEQDLITSKHDALLKIQQLTGDNNIKIEQIANGVYSFQFLKQGINSNYIVKSLKSSPMIKYIVPDRVGYFKPIATPKLETNLAQQLKNNNENGLTLNQTLQWDLFNAPAGIFVESKPNLSDGGWRYSRGGAQDNEVVVAVLDTGMEYNSNLADNVVKSPETGNFFGWNFSADNDSFTDDTGSYHGTHVAGTIAGHGPDVYGVGPALKILPVKVCTSEGLFYESKVIKGIYWAIGEPVEGAPVNPYPAKVINMSFGIDEYVGNEADACSPAVQEAIDYARSKGVNMVVAAGNSNMANDLGSPGGCTGTIRVASTGPTGQRSYFSNYGEGISLAAPGGDKRYGDVGGILSTVKPNEGINGSDFDFYQGTSMASPHVAGLAGLLHSINDFSKNYTSDDIEKIMYTTTHNFGNSVDNETSCRGTKSCGHGIIDANNALAAGVANYDVIYSAPNAKLLGLESDENCRNNLIKPKHKKVLTPVGTWSLVEDSSICQNELDYNHPSLSIDKQSRQVTAKYGHVEYSLNYVHSSCEQIGFDGIGCFK